MEPSLWQTWQQTASRYSSHQYLINRLWQELLNAYSSPSRHYHTFHHIAALLRLTQAHENHLTAPTLVRLAVFYHDAVYSAARSDNEEKSAQLAQERLSHLGVPYPETTLVTEMIMATKTHQAGSHPDLNFLLDADLSIMGLPGKTTSSTANRSGKSTAFTQIFCTT
ncbi:HD domain-containing protein [Rufibacter psychrotolerans]|uniref:HD domain-containing protein n=1 Tax=Rufibacter psychrotolerans TaxID=2812556 RepID=UPI0019679349|nr:hypothetical protein [Rufibacter sp. SYSU D00308]